MGNDSNGVKKKILWLAVPGSAKIEGGDSTETPYRGREMIRQVVAAGCVCSGVGR